MNKLKAQLAMVAFVVVALAATGLTTAGAFNYLALNLGVPAQLSQAVQSAPLGIVSLASSLAPQSGK
jgi:hypothetical protein